MKYKPYSIIKLTTALVLHTITFLPYNAYCAPNYSVTPKYDSPALFTSSLISNYATLEEVQLLQTRHLVNIAILETPHDDKFIVKQDVENLLVSVLRAAREKLGVTIAQSIELRTNLVEIIPVNYSFIGKHITAFPATLHTFAPGIQVSQLSSKSPFYTLDILQASNSAKPTSQFGLRYSVIQNMAQHVDLPAIVALDTFIGNRGRHRNNYFYCPESDHFYLIDMESCLATHLGMYACNCIQQLLNDTAFTLPPQEVIALTRYNDTIKKLISLYTPDSIYEQLITNISACNSAFTQKNDIPEIRKIKKTIEEQLALYAAMIQQNYESCIRLTSLLDQLINR